MKNLADLPPLSSVVPTPDPWLYGFRYVERRDADGKESFDQQPLSLADCLHPRCGYTITESTTHNLVRGHLSNVCRLRVHDEPASLVLSNCVVLWDRPELKSHGPDVAVIKGLQQQQSKMKRLADEAKARADAETARADAAEARTRELQAELARLKGQPNP